MGVKLPVVLGMPALRAAQVSLVRSMAMISLYGIGVTRLYRSESLWPVLGGSIRHRGPYVVSMWSMGYPAIRLEVIVVIGQHPISAMGPMAGPVSTPNVIDVIEAHTCGRWARW